MALIIGINEKKTAANFTFITALALCRVKAIAGCGIIEIFHCLFNFLLHIAILCLIVERTVFKYNNIFFGICHTYPSNTD